MKAAGTSYVAARSKATFVAANALFGAEKFRGTIFEPFRVDTGIWDAAYKHGISTFTTSLGLFDYDRNDITTIVSELIHNGVSAEDRGIYIRSAVDKAIYLAVSKVAFLMPLEGLATEPMRVIAKETPLARIYLIEKRLKYRKGAMAWYVWERGWLEPPVLRWL